MKGEQNFCVRYRWLGEVFGTVVSAQDASEARKRFERENPGVEVVEIL